MSMHIPSLLPLWMVLSPFVLNVDVTTWFTITLASLLERVASFFTGVSTSTRPGLEVPIDLDLIRQKHVYNQTIKDKGAYSRTKHVQAKCNFVS